MHILFINMKSHLYHIYQYNTYGIKFTKYMAYKVLWANPNNQYRLKKI